MKHLSSRDSYQKLTEWKNEFLDGFDSCAAILQVELDALNRELADERSGIQDRSLEKHLRWEVNKLTTQLQSANAKLDKAIKCLKAVKEDIEANATDTLWCHEGYAMTIVDRIEIYLEAMDASEGKVEND